MLQRGSRFVSSAAECSSDSDFLEGQLVGGGGHPRLVAPTAASTRSPTASQRRVSRRRRDLGPRATTSESAWPTPAPATQAAGPVTPDVSPPPAVPITSPTSSDRTKERAPSLSLAARARLR